MIKITKIECGAYKVTHLFDNYSPVMYATLYEALNLCRLRLNKCRKHETDKDPLIIIKVPFVNLWLVW